MLICLVEVTLSKLVHPLDGENNKNLKFDKHYFNLVCYLTGLGPLNPSSRSYDADNTNTTIIWYLYPNYVLMQHVTLTNAEILLYKIPQLGVTKLTVNPKFQYFSTSSHMLDANSNTPNPFYNKYQFHKHILLDQLKHRNFHLDD